MAQGARLEKSVLIVERRSSRRTAEARSGMALQAQQVYVAHLQHVADSDRRVANGRPGIHPLSPLHARIQTVLACPYGT